MLRLPYYFFNIEKFFEEKKVRINAGILRIVKLFSIIMFIQHIIACAWFLIAALAVNTHNTWAEFDGIADKDIGEKYIRSFYFTVTTMNTVGYGDISPQNNFEQFFAILVMIVGATFYAGMVASTASLVENLDATAASFRKKMDYLGQYMAHRNIPQKLDVRIREYNDYLWTRQKGLAEEQVWLTLPAHLRNEIAYFLAKDMLKKVPMFKKLPENVAREICRCLEPRICSPQDYIFLAGELGAEMIFLFKGTADIVSDSSADGRRRKETVLKTVSDGTYIGEETLFEVQTRSVSVRCATYCDLFALYKDDFDVIFRMYPSHIDAMKTVLAEKGSSTEKVLNIAKNMKNTKLNKMFTQEEEDSGSKRYVIMPGSKFRRIWDSLMLFHCVYMWVAIPLRYAFMYSSSYHTTGLFAWLGVDYVLDILIVVEMVFQWRFYGFLEGGRKVDDAIYIKRRYLRSWFTLDLISVIPYDVFAPIGSTAIARVHLQLALRIPKLVRIFKLNYYIRTIEEFVHHEVTYITNTMTRLFKLLCALVLLANSMCSIWFLLAQSQGLDTRGPNNGTFTGVDADPWAYKENLSSMNLSRRYLRSFYWAVTTMTMVGYGEITPVTVGEDLVAIFAMLIGSLMYAALIASVTSIFRSRDATAIIFRKKMDCLKQYLVSKEMNDNLTQRILDVYEYRWHVAKGLNEDRILSELPVPLAQDVAMSLHEDLLIKVPFFQDTSPAFLAKIAMVLKPQVMQEAEYICKHGEIGRDMYFIEAGKCEVLLQTGKQVATLGPGDFLGEIALFYSVPRTAHVRALSNCILYCLSQVDFEQTLLLYPEYVDTMSEIAWARLQSLSDLVGKPDDSTNETTAAHAIQRALSSPKKGIFAFLDNEVEAAFCIEAALSPRGKRTDILRPGSAPLPAVRVHQELENCIEEAEEEAEESVEAASPVQPLQLPEVRGKKSTLPPMEIQCDDRKEATAKEE
jgi:CRP-like cAMP-binding protein/voltage-gated potassium channel Kch